MSKVKDSIPEGLSTKIVMRDNSFAFCVSEVTGIPTELFSDINHIMHDPAIEGWHQPYIDVLRHHSYDMIFFSFGDDPLVVNDEKRLEDYQFDQLPSGKCLVLGNTKELWFKCAVGQMKPDFTIDVVYDPDSSCPFQQVHQVGYFISTFVKPEVESEVTIVNSDECVG